MEQNALLFYLETLHNALGIPLVYGDEDGTLYRFQPFSITNGENELEFIKTRLHNIYRQFPKHHLTVMLHPHQIMVGMAIDPNSNRFVFVGPLAGMSISEEDIADYLFPAGLSMDTTRQLSSYLSRTKLWTADTVFQLMLNINLALNGEMLSTEEIGLVNDSETNKQLLFYKKHYEREVEDQEHKEPIQFQDYSDQLSYCLMTGNTTELLKMLDQFDQLGSIPFTADISATLSHARQTAYGSVFASENVALKSGIPASNLKTTKQYYLDRIDQAATQEECRTLCIRAILDFSKNVKEYLAVEAENPAIRRAIEYIKENLNTKLLAADIANAAHVNVHYLFTKFKTETGKTLTAYINEEKIKKARYYILYTENSFSEIAISLSFSSQSYFQTVFKKITGKTPNRWKLENKK